MKSAAAQGGDWLRESEGVERDSSVIVIGQLWLGSLDCCCATTTIVTALNLSNGLVKHAKVPGTTPIKEVKKKRREYLAVRQLEGTELGA